jgi:hypothetical protein
VSESYKAQYPLGLQVCLGDNIKGIIERIIWARAMTEPLYLIEWWNDGQVLSREMLQNDIRPWGDRR